MKTVFASILAGLAVADPSDFPKFDMMHANCAMQVDFPLDCTSLWVQMNAELENWATGGPSQGIYAIYEESEPSYIWTTRTTPIKKYVDD